MKYLFLFLLSTFLLTACGGDAGVTAERPTDVAGLKKLLRERKTDLKALNQEIAEIEASVEKLEPSKEKARRLVTVNTINKKDFNRFVDIQASVQSGDAVMASSETGGRIIKLSVDEGSFVRRGQLIAKLDMESVNKQIAELETSLDLAREVFNRQSRLWEQNIGSELQYLQAKNNKDRLEKSLETVRHQLTKANVSAPISGVVDKVFAQGGEMAGPGTPIVQIISTGQVKVVADVPENYLGTVKKGERVTVKFPALNEERKARVSMIGRTIDPSNRTFKVEVEIGNKGGVLKPNLLALMLINDYSEKGAVFIPLDLVQQEVSGRDYVYVKGEGEEGAIAQKVYIETGESYDGNIIIQSGLNQGDILIMEGARGLTDNELIEVKDVTDTADQANGK